MKKKDYINYLNAVDKVCIDCMFYAPDTEDGEAACEQCPVRKTCNKMAESIC